jgi:uncharacterized protein (TIGR02145 family)
MKKTLFLLTMFCAIEANAQNYFISFTGSGAAETVGSVKVENLTAGTSLTVPSGNILSLAIPTGVNSPEDKQSSELNIYPNPSTGNSFFRIYPPAEGDATISVFDINGKSIYQIKRNLERDLQEFRISGLNSGFYMVRVKGNTYQYSGKLVSNAEASGKISIEKTGNNVPVIDKSSKSDTKDVNETKGAPPVVEMTYTDGDRLKFTGISGIYSTVVTDIPASSKVINFIFVPCTDGDNNNYPVVDIGGQIWMAENLRTTKYNDCSTSIPNVTDEAAWSELNTGAYSDYNNTPANSTIYGRLYNWYAVDNNETTREASNGSKNVCPTGWHVPSDAEWTTLTTFLGGESIAGGKLKETGTTHWIVYNTGATNETGFTALPGGNRGYVGASFDIGTNGSWWGSTEYSSPCCAWSRNMGRGITNVNSIGYLSKLDGFSVRCLKDN